MTCSALFLDRDGVININHGHVHKIENFDFIEGVFELVKKANNLAMPVIIITNQGGIGRGLYSEDIFHTLMNKVIDIFQEHEAVIDDVYFCPNHPEYGVGYYKRPSHYRKPAPGMILQAAKDHGLDLLSSVLVGDKITDMDAGKSAGVGKLFLFSKTEKYPDAHIISSLAEVALGINI